MREQVLWQVAVNSLVTARSSDIKLMFVRVLKEAAVAIKEVVEAMSRNLVSAEIKKLMAHNRRLQEEVAKLRSELATIQANMPYGVTRSSPVKRRACWLAPCPAT